MVKFKTTISEVKKAILNIESEMKKESRNLINDNKTVYFVMIALYKYMGGKEDMLKHAVTHDVFSQFSEAELATYMENANTFIETAYLYMIEEEAVEEVRKMRVSRATFEQRQWAAKLQIKYFANKVAEQYKVNLDSIAKNEHVFVRACENIMSLIVGVENFKKAYTSEYIDLVYKIRDNAVIER